MGKANQVNITKLGGLALLIKLVSASTDEQKEKVGWNHTGELC